MSALSAVEAAPGPAPHREGPPFQVGPRAESPANRAAAQRRQHLQLVTGGARSGQPRAGWPAVDGERGRIRVARGSSASRLQPDVMPLRLTRRGRIVVSALAVILAATVLTVISMSASGGAQAASHGRPGEGHQGMREIVVQQGQTLWSIATAVAPSADPRLVIAQVMAANSLRSTAVEAGEELWVPK